MQKALILTRRLHCGLLALGRHLNGLLQRLLKNQRCAPSIVGAAEEVPEPAGALLSFEEIKSSDPLPEPEPVEPLAPAGSSSSCGLQQPHCPTSSGGQAMNHPRALGCPAPHVGHLRVPFLALFHRLWFSQWQGVNPPPPDALIFRSRRAYHRAQLWVIRCRAAHPGAWEHSIFFLKGPDANSYNPDTVEAVAEFVKWLLGDCPALFKVEVGEFGQLHVHLLTPAGRLPSTEKIPLHVTQRGVEIDAQRRWLSKAIIAADDDVGLRKLIRYLMKPSHAGYKYYRRFGPYDPRYLAALRALEAGQAMCGLLGRGTLPRTLRALNIPPLVLVTGLVLRQLRGKNLRHRMAGWPVAPRPVVAGTSPANKGTGSGAAALQSPVLSAHGPARLAPVVSGRGDQAGPAALTAPAYRSGPAGPSAQAAALAQPAAGIQGRGAGGVTAQLGGQEASTIAHQAEAAAYGRRDQSVLEVTTGAAGHVMTAVSREVQACDPEPP